MSQATDDGTQSGPHHSRPLDRYPIWWGEILTGTREQLIEAGIAKPEWFPGLPGNNKGTQSILIPKDGAPYLVVGKGRDARQPDGGEKIQIYAKGKGVFTVRYFFSRERCEVEREFGDDRLLRQSIAFAQFEFIGASLRTGVRLRIHAPTPA